MAIVRPYSPLKRIGSFIGPAFLGVDKNQGLGSVMFFENFQKPGFFLLFNLVAGGETGCILIGPRDLNEEIGLP